LLGLYFYLFGGSNSWVHYTLAVYELIVGATRGVAPTKPSFEVW